MKKMSKVVALGVGLASLFVLGQAPAQADAPADAKHVIQLDTGWD